MVGPLLFNIDQFDLLLECEVDNINRYMDGTTPYSCAEDLPVITELQKIAKNISGGMKTII